jgi:diguanylate cyclase (GGDEF)-like protein/PAS domain S-box-containing protein
VRPRNPYATIFERLLSRFPDAAVVALDEHGDVVPCPASLDVGAHPGTGGVPPAALVAPEWHREVEQAWERARHDGVGRAVVPLTARSDRLAVLHFVDVREEHGVYVAILAPEGEPLPDTGPRRSAPPRHAVQVKDEMATVTEVDDALVAMLGFPREDLVGRRSLDLVHPDDRAKAIDAWMDLLQRPGASNRVRVRHRHADGGWRWLEVINHNRLQDPFTPRVVGEVVDVTDEMAAHDALRTQERLLRRLTEAFPHGVMQIDPSGRIEVANARAQALLGSGGTMDDLLVDVLAADRAEVERAVAAVLADGDDREVDFGMVPSSTEGIRYRRLLLRALMDEDGRVEGIVACLEDTTEHTRMQRELHALATLDGLTGCHNRASIQAVLRMAVAQGGRQDLGTAVLFVDLDRFKDVNDRRGHAAGDAVLRTVAQRMLAAVRGGDVVGRVGGDEFLVVLPEVAGPEQAMHVADRLAGAIREPVDAAGEPVLLTASVGAVWTPPGSGTPPEGLVELADHAMYASKRRRDGRPVLVVAEPEHEGPPPEPGQPL